MRAEITQDGLLLISRSAAAFNKANWVSVGLANFTAPFEAPSRRLTSSPQRRDFAEDLSVMMAPVTFRKILARKRS